MMGLINNVSYKLQNKFNLSSYISISQKNRTDYLKRDINEAIFEMENHLFFLKKNLNLNQDITFGLELEFEDANFIEVDKLLRKIVNTSNIFSWKVVPDTSVTKENSNNEICGGEIVTPILRDSYTTWNEVNKVCAMLTHLNANVDGLAGGHIHFGTQILGDNPQHWINLLKLWTVFEKVIYRFSYGEKSSPRERILSYAKPVAAEFYNVLKYIKDAEFNLKELIKILGSDSDQAINFSNVTDFDYKRDNTIEIRCPNMSLNPVVWQNNVNFFANLLLYCKSDNFNHELLDAKLKTYSEEECNIENYQNLYYEEAMQLADLIFTNNKDRIYFLKQYHKCFNKEKENVKQKVLVR